MKTWDEVKDTIHERLLSSQWQGWELSGLAKVNAAADLWRTWYIDGGDAGGIRCIASVTDEQMQAWGVTTDDLEKAARENDAENYTVSYLRDLGGSVPAGVDPAMYYVTNQDSFFGAAGIFNENVQAKLAELYPSGYYVLPYTVTECVVLSAGLDVKGVADMVYRIVHTEIEEEERLSDRVFRVENGRLVFVAKKEDE